MIGRIFIFQFFLALILVGSMAYSQPIDLDNNWDSRFYLNGLDGIAHCTIEYQGNIIIGGRFTHAGRIRAEGVVGWNPILRNFFSLGDGVDGVVTSLGIFEGDLVVSGGFSNASGVSASNIARWDGSTWSAMGDGLATSAGIMAEFQGDLYTKRYRWTGNQWVDFTQTTGVKAMAVHDGKLIFGGSFTRIHDVPAENAASWDGVTIQPMEAGLNPDVHNLQIVGSYLYATSDTPYINGSYNQLVQRWSGSYWSNRNFSIEGFYGGIEWVVMGEYQDQLVVMTGIYGHYDSVTISRTLDGGEWVEFPLFPGDNIITVNSLQEEGGRLLLVGDFEGTVSYPAPNIIEVNGNNAFPLLSFGQGLPMETLSICGFDGGLVAGGNFDHAGTTEARGAASWNGSSWTPMHQVGENGYSQPAGHRDGFSGFATDGQSLIGNFLDYSNFSQQRYFSIWDSNEDYWEPSTNGMDKFSFWNGEIYAISVYGNAYLLQDEDWVMIGDFPGFLWDIEPMSVGLVIGGNFEEIDGIPVQNVAVWDGASWNSMGEGIPLNCLALNEYNGQIVASSGNSVFSWDGNAWGQMGNSFYGSIRCLEQYGSHLYAGGNFRFGEDQPDCNLAYWDGNAWHPYGKGVQGQVKEMVILGDNLYLGGEILQAGNWPSAGIACMLQPLPSTTSVDSDITDQGGILLEPGHPNPFNPTTEITFSLSRASKVQLGVYDIRGRLVTMLVDGVRESGTHAVTWNGRDRHGQAMPSGVYFTRLTRGSDIRTRKIILAK